MRLWVFISLLMLIGFSSCRQSPDSNDAVFSVVSPAYSNIQFNNKLEFTEEYNPYTFKNFLNGGGVALGDINNDGLVDIYLTGNLVPNKLYLNTGDFKFKDITEEAGVACSENWSTGACFVDLNHDGLLDLYVCKSGKPEGPNRFNQLFINNGVSETSGKITFTDQAEAFGLDFTGLSIHSAFFDYDKDGDLDCYLLNNSIRSVGAYDIIEGLRERPDPKGGNKLLKNLEVETGQIRFEDVSQAAGIYTSEIGFGLGVSVADLNGDHWDDIFVSNDFFERDYLYINQQDGTFKEKITTAMPELSMGSMGADIADLNNDGLPDLFVTEMLPEQLDRYKSKTVFESYDKSVLNRSKGYHNQFGRNVLQYNTGTDNDIPQFIELGRYHGVEATDWSWGALMADFDNNGLKDIFVANGIAKDLLDQDHISFYDAQEIGRMIKSGKKDVITTIIEAFPKEKLSNYLFLQDSTRTFVKTELSPADQPSFSNGSAYADLDNDGDLDLVLNTIDEPARIYKNETGDLAYLQIKLIGDQLNTKAIGSKVFAYSGNEQYYLDLNPMRGYQSCVDYTLHFGLNNATRIDSLKIIWPNGMVSTYLNLATNALHEFDIQDAKASIESTTSLKTANATLLQKTQGILNFTHQENRFSDFDFNRMMLHMISNEGPKGHIEDLDGDGNPELLITGSSGESCAYFTWQDGGFHRKEIAAFDEFKTAETTGFIVHDFNTDGQKDILLLNGGSEFPKGSQALQDQLIIRSGEAFAHAPALIPTGFNPSSAGTTLDIDQDGKEEIIIGFRLEPLAYGMPAAAVLFKKENGTYVKDQALNSPLQKIGMVKDLASADLNNDGIPEIIFSRECDALLVLEYQANKGLVPLKNAGLEKFKGFWNDIEITDIDNDGDQDIVAGNFGLNQRFKNLSSSPLYLFVNDFDANGRVDMIYCVKKGEDYFPIHLRNDLVQQIPILKKKTLKYKDYAQASMADLFDQELLSQSIIHEINEYRTGVFINQGETFNFVPLPEEVQYSEQKAVWSGDLNNDGWTDLVLGGNQYETKPEIGMNAASYGHVLLNQQDGTFRALPHATSGFFEKGQIRDILDFSINNERYLIVLKNSAEASVYKISN